MTAVNALAPAPSRMARLAEGRTVPVVSVLLVIFVLWFVGAALLNADRAREQLTRAEAPTDIASVIGTAWTLERPVLPTPAQIAGNLYDSTVGVAFTRADSAAEVVERFFSNRRSLVYHAWVTMSTTLAGFALGTALGIALAVGIVHVVTLDRSLMPWVIASQTVPILAIAPMIVVVLGNAGLGGIWPKAIISAYLSFFPVTIGMVKGLRSIDRLHADLMRTYSASRWHVFQLLRVPTSIPYLFPSLKVGIALSLVGAIVAELPTGATAGLGARLLAGSYYGQMVPMWSALILSAVLALVLIALVGLAEKLVAATRGGRM